MKQLISSDELKHYGVLGMRWGRRKGSVDTSSNKKGSNNKNENRRMSNKELNSRLRRLRLESEYAKLTAKPESKSKIDKLVKSAGTIAALSTSALTIYNNLNKITEAVNKAKGA